MSDDERTPSEVSGRVVAVHRDASHRFSKSAEPSVTLIAGLGVDGDAHQGATVRHRSRVAVDPSQPNLRQVHLIHAELHDELSARGFRIAPGDMGENVTTRGIALLDLPVGTTLRIGSSALVALTGLRNPCAQLDRFQHGLLAAVLERAADGSPIPKAGVMGTVLQGGVIQPGDGITIALPPRPHRRLERV